MNRCRPTETTSRTCAHGAGDLVRPKKELLHHENFLQPISKICVPYTSQSLKKALDMEQKITDALPKMIDQSTDPQLAQAFCDHPPDRRPCGQRRSSDSQCHG